MYIYQQNKDPCSLLLQYTPLFNVFNAFSQRIFIYNPHPKKFSAHTSIRDPNQLCTKKADPYQQQKYMH